MSNTTIKGIEQGRAKQAYSDVLAAQTQLRDKAKEYKSYAKKLPMMIKTNGLGASIAFAQSKGRNKGNAWEVLYLQIESWLQKERSYLLGNYAKMDLAQAVVSLDSPQYRAVTVETLAYLNWLRRFAEGLIEGEAEEIAR